MKRKKPNVLFLMADDHRHDAIGACGHPDVRTPVLDSLAASGTMVKGMHTMGGLSCAVCAPARAALHTGVNPIGAGATRIPDQFPEILHLNDELTTMPQAFREAGYFTYGIGKWHNERKSFTAGFCGGATIMFKGMSDHHAVPVYSFDPTGSYPESNLRIGEGFSTELFTDEAVKFICDYNQEVPFFLYVAFTSPHDPRTPPAEFRSMYEPGMLTLPPNLWPEHPFDNGEIAIRDEALAPWPRTDEIIREHLADYYGMISHMDQQIGRILKALRELGELENTIIVYTGDHGLALGQHGLLGKQNLYEHSVRIPFLLNGPGIPAGRQVDVPVQQTDIFPTLCDLAGVPIPDRVEGESQASLVQGETEQGRDYVFSMYKDAQRMVSDGEWKLIRYYVSRQRGNGTNRLQLFHLAKDPWELNDLSREPAHEPQLIRLAERLKRWQLDIDDINADLPVLTMALLGRSETGCVE